MEDEVMNPYKINMASDSRKQLKELIYKSDEFWDMLERRNLLIAHDEVAIRVRTWLSITHAAYTLHNYGAFTINPYALSKAGES